MQEKNRITYIYKKIIEKNYYLHFLFQTTQELIDKSYATLVEPIKPDCLKESGADPDLVDKAIKLGEFSEDQNSKCFWKCYFKKVNIINNDDEIQEENIKQYIGLPDAKLVEEIHKKCAPIRGSDLCDTCQKILQCIITNAKALFAK